MTKVEAVCKDKFRECSDYGSVKVRFSSQNVSWIVIGDVHYLFYWFYCMLNVVLHLFWLKGCQGKKESPRSACFTEPRRSHRGRCGLYFPGRKPGGWDSEGGPAVQRQLEQMGTWRIRHWEMPEMKR